MVGGVMSTTTSRMPGAADIMFQQRIPNTVQISTFPGSQLIHQEWQWCIIPNLVQMLMKGQGQWLEWRNKCPSMCGVGLSPLTHSAMLRLWRRKIELSFTQCRVEYRSVSGPSDSLCISCLTPMMMTGKSERTLQTKTMMAYSVSVIWFRKLPALQSGCGNIYYLFLKLVGCYNLFKQNKLQADWICLYVDMTQRKKEYVVVRIKLM